MSSSVIILTVQYDETAGGAIAQIKERNYTASLADYSGNIVLCGINYDRQSKTHTCSIEQLIVNISE